MLRRRLTPGQWRALPKAERVEMMAFDRLNEQGRAALLRQITAEMPGEVGALAQVFILLQGE